MGGWSSLVRIYKLGLFLATQTSSPSSIKNTHKTHNFGIKTTTMATSKTRVLAGKKVVIIGGSSGLGFAAASALIEEGAHVVIGSSSSDKVSAAVANLSDPSLQFNADPSRVSGYTVNLSGGAAEASLREFFGKIGAFDHLIHTAGDTLRMKPLGEWDYKSLVEAGDVRYFSAILAVKIATEDPNLLRRNSGGSVVLTTGAVAEKPMPNWSAVAGYAAALYGLTRGLALDLSDKGIRVNCISPGPVETELWSGIPDQQRKAMLNEMGSKLLTGKIGQPHEVAHTYVYLLKDTNQTGQIINTDGGSTLTDRPQ
jgi:NAD(P)-dependent dehydrogenase (short-subunit alcohol dehydrogenase family)